MNIQEQDTEETKYDRPLSLDDTLVSPAPKPRESRTVEYLRSFALGFIGALGMSLVLAATTPLGVAISIGFTGGLVLGVSGI